jgi:hypothetical protein
MQRATAFMSGTAGRSALWLEDWAAAAHRAAGPVSFSPPVKVIVAVMVVSVLDLSEYQCPYGVRGVYRHAGYGALLQAWFGSIPRLGAGGGSVSVFVTLIVVRRERPHGRAARKQG